MTPPPAGLGVIYLAFGPPYLAMSLVSAASVRVTNPGVPVCIVTNVAAAPPPLPWWDQRLGDAWVWVDRGTAENRLLKTDIARYSPYEKTVLLDCDTLVLRRLDPITTILDHFDVALRFVAWPSAEDGHRTILNGALQLGDVSHFNSGIVAFRRGAAVDDFFETWQACFDAMGIDRDQPALVEALFLSGARLLPLREEWNAGEYWSLNPAMRQRIYMWHYKARSVDRRIESYIRLAVEWFSEDPARRQEVETYLQSRRWTQRHIDPLWRFKAVLREVRGALSTVPAQLAGEDRWRRMISPAEGVAARPRSGHD